MAFTQVTATVGTTTKETVLQRVNTALGEIDTFIQNHIDNHPGGAFTGFLVAQDEGIAGDETVDDIAAWEALVGKAASTGKAILFGKHLTSRLSRTLNITSPNIHIFGGGKLVGDAPDITLYGGTVDGSGNVNTSAMSYDNWRAYLATGYTILKWDGANGYFEGELDGRYHTETANSQGGSTTTRLFNMNSQGFVFRGKIRRAAHYGMDIYKACDIWMYESKDCAYHGGRLMVTTPIEQVTIHCWYGEKSPTVGERYRMFDFSVNGTAGLGTLHVKDMRLKNCTFLGEADTTSSGGTHYYDRMVFDHLVVSQNTRFTNPDGTVATITLGKIQNTRHLVIHRFEGYSNVDGCYGPWWESAASVTVGSYHSNCFEMRLGGVARVGKYSFLRRNGAGGTSAGSFIRALSSGARVHIDDMHLDDNNVAMTYSTSYGIFNCMGKTERQITVGRLRMAGASISLARTDTNTGSGVIRILDEEHPNITISKSGLVGYPSFSTVAS